MTPPMVEIESVSKAFGGGPQVLTDVSLQVEEGEFFTLLGPSGSGKTTVLRIIAGLIDADARRAYSSAGEDVTGRPAYERDLAVVFQSLALFPHLSVRDNVAFPLRMRRAPRKERRERVDEALELVQLPDVAERRVERAERWPAPARRPGPGAGLPAAHCCCSTSRSRPWTAGCARACSSSSAPASRARRDDHQRHARPARGAVAEPPHRPARGRPDGPGRPRRGPLPPARRRASSPASSATRCCSTAPSPRNGTRAPARGRRRLTRGSRRYARRSRHAQCCGPRRSTRRRRRRSRRVRTTRLPATVNFASFDGAGTFYELELELRPDSGRPRSRRATRAPPSTRAAVQSSGAPGRRR